MAVKYQIFVSSTYEDLKQEREQAIKAILEIGHVPVGMEMFSAADDDQWKVITRTIDECDYYIVIAAHRYGSVDPKTNVSYTEREYDYAVKKGIPALGFVIKPDAKWPAHLMDTAVDKKTALDLFKQKIHSKYISHWASTDDLYGKVGIAISKEINVNPRVGWIRADQAASPDAIRELSRLSRENDELRKQLAEVTAANQQAVDDEDRKVLSILKQSTIQISVREDGKSDWTMRGTPTLERLFNLMAPILITEKALPVIAVFLATLYSPSNVKPSKSWPVARNSVLEILADFIALGLIAPSSKKHPAADTEEYWVLTDKGREIHTSIRRQRLEAGLPAAEPMPNEADIAVPKSPNAAPQPAVNQNS